MNLFSLLSTFVGAKRPTAPRPRGQRALLGIEVLEDRQLLSTGVISGFVYHDANNNGLRDGGEGPIPHSALELRNASGVVVASTHTNANGYYEFSVDRTIDTRPTTQEFRVSFADAKTNAPQTRTLPQFDPARGTLLAVQIQIRGRITSDVRVENLDPAPTTVVASVSGELTVSGPQFASMVTTSSKSQSFLASAYDGTLDFGGSSGKAFGAETVTGARTVVNLGSPAQLAPYLGTGSITLQEVAQANSFANGGGNLSALLNSAGGADVTVVYQYVPSNSLRPGSYTISQTTQPADYLDGKESSDGVVVVNSVGRDVIAVVLTNAGSRNNHFAELRPAQLAGMVYLDGNQNGRYDGGENGISGVTVMLSGIDDGGKPVQARQTTAGNGAYRFANLRPGVYTITEMQPEGYLDGKEGLGSAGGSVGNDQFSNITLPVGANGSDYNFAELARAVNPPPPAPTPNVPPPSSAVSKLQFLASSARKNRR